jgi:D-lactate dehydrogenase
LVTAHQAFFTQEALTAIAETTLASITAFERGEELTNAVTQAFIVPR